MNELKRSRLGYCGLRPFLPFYTSKVGEVDLLLWASEIPILMVSNVKISFLGAHRSY